MSERRSPWNAVALVATLGLATLVAVVAVTRSETPVSEPTPTPSASPSPSGSATPGGLGGEGPYIVYASKDAVFAFDVASQSTVSLGSIDAVPVPERSRQPGNGRVVAFVTTEGSVWTVKRPGMRRVGAIPQRAGTTLTGGAASPDDRRLAVAVLGSEPSTVVVDLQTGRPRLIPRARRGQYPPEALLPVAWSFGGSVLYQIPFCRCDAGSPGLYSLDTATGTSAVLSGTRTTTFDQLVVSNSGQSMYYGTGTPRRCRTGEREPCDRAPYALRRLAAGRRGVETLRRADDARFVPTAISQDGRMILVARGPAGVEGTRWELYNADGDRQPSIRGIPDAANAVALLRGDVVVATTASPAAIVLVRQGRSETIARSAGPAEEPLFFLGWLR